jgi:uncharacterized repeat protein (TIGR03843 family)
VINLENLQVTGRLLSASNVTLQCVDSRSLQKYVYKPESGERPLWDFPLGTLTRREIAAYNLDRLLGWQIVPSTTWIHEGPNGPGMFQEWIDEVDLNRPVNIFTPDKVPTDWITILAAHDSHDREVHLAHANTLSLKRMAIFDAIANNADRKAGHILADENHEVFGIDHGVCFNTDNKLRTVLWGWAGEPIDQDILKDLHGLQTALGSFSEPIDPWLSDLESIALRSRLDRLLRTGEYPTPSIDWPAIPWPVF